MGKEVTRSCIRWFNMDITTCVHFLGLIQVFSSACLDGWEHHGGFCYFRSSVSVNFEEARCVCGNLQATLFRVNSAEDLVFLDASLRHTTEPYWLGSTDLRDGVYVWGDGSPVTALEWDTNQPDHFADDHCIVYMQDKTMWGLQMLDKHYALDTSCYFEAHPYCQKPIGGVQSEQRMYRGRDVLHPDHTFMEVKANGLLDCYSTCALNCRCLSFSFCAGTRRCLLYARYANQLGGVRRHETGCKLYD